MDILSLSSQGGSKILLQKFLLKSVASTYGLKKDVRFN